MAAAAGTNKRPNGALRCQRSCVQRSRCCCAVAKWPAGPDPPGNGRNFMVHHIHAFHDSTGFTVLILLRVVALQAAGLQLIPIRRTWASASP